MTDYLTDANNDIKTYFETNEIPTYFYNCLFGELIKIYGVSPLIPDKDYLAEYDDDGNIISSNGDNYSYKDQIDYYFNMLCGTAGWNLGFKEACAQCELTQLYQDYKNTDWIRSDIFDGYIVDQMLEVLFSKDLDSDYYFFKIRKEKNNEYNQKNN